MRNTITLSAEDAFERGMGAFGVQRDLKTRYVILYDHVLIEDDGPGVSAEHPRIDEAQRPIVESLSEKSWMKKILRVDRPQAESVKVYARTHGVDAFRFNGREVTGDVPPEMLRRGDNEVVFSAKGTVTVAKRALILESEPERKDRPPRSFKSTDGGRTWAPVEGECVVRLILKQYLAEGHFVSPVMDLGRCPGDGSVLLSRATVRSVALRCDSETPDGTRIDLTIRTGSRPAYEREFWSDWNTRFAEIPGSHRYLQWKATLTTGNPLVTPVVKSVTVEAVVLAEAPPAWADRVKVAGVRNEEIRYTSMPFEYEDPDHPRMVALRTKYKLDDVVRDGKTEFERMVRLKDWVSKQWKYKPPEGRYPAWDADEIMTRKIGFCVQYAITFVQCAASLGHQARFVFGFHPGVMGGHEISEVWSNEYRKWVAMDANGNRFYYDPQLNVPLSMLETHDRMVKHYYGDRFASPDNAPKTPSYAQDLVSVHGLATFGEQPGDKAPTKFPAWSKWLLIRYVPRNNFYGRPEPLPRIQGWGGWTWPYHWVWYDAQTPKRNLYYYNYTSRVADLEWTLNQVCFDATYGERPGTLNIQMGTFTPHFETFLVNIDGKGWVRSGGAFVWNLSPGANRLQMRVRNKAGVEGPISFLEVTRE